MYEYWENTLACWIGRLMDNILYLYHEALLPSTLIYYIKYEVNEAIFRKNVFFIYAKIIHFYILRKFESKGF